MKSDCKSLCDKSQKPLKAVAQGTLKIGAIEIDCAILENGAQVIMQKSLLKLMGRSHPGGRPTKEIEILRKDGVEIPVFVAANNLIPFISLGLSNVGSSIAFTPLKGGRALGFNAEIIPEICDVYLNARKKGNILTKVQIPIAETCEIILQGLSRVGISILVNEACGIPTSEKDYYQRILNEFIDKKLLPYVKRFPDSFWHEYKRIYGIPTDQNIPSHVGCFINKYIYNELAPGVLEALRELNPVQENGRRRTVHHRYLTENKGVIELEKQLLKIVTLLKISKNKNDFLTYYEEVK